MSVFSIPSDLQNVLNPSILTPDSLQGVFVLLALAFIVWCLFKKTIRFIKFSVIFLCIMQLGFVLGQTALNDIVPLSDWFKYDVFAALAQLCVGTPVASFFLWLSRWISGAMVFLAERLAGVREMTPWSF